MPGSAPLDGRPILAVLVFLLAACGDDPAPPAPDEHASTGPAAVSTPAPFGIRDAVLASPALASREVDGAPVFRVTGEPTVVSDEPGAGGFRRLVVELTAERRLAPDAAFSPETIRLVAFVDTDGRVLRVEVIGVANADDVEMERLLEDWR